MDCGCCALYVCMCVRVCVRACVREQPQHACPRVCVVWREARAPRKLVATGACKRRFAAHVTPVQFSSDCPRSEFDT